MKNLTNSLIGGIAGAIALNILHQTVKQFVHEAPRVDLIGEEGIARGMERAGFKPLTGDALFSVTLVTDLISNSAYYMMIGMGKKKYLLYHGAAHGLCAGIGALTLIRPMGLSDAPVARTNATRLMTVAWYTFGGIIAGWTMKALRK
ncbi:hypothetical protein AAFN85_25855 [Mucilaginibacter sp. CAU 1740]|uniref:hypothetical protein n=1 Tax=Mucilaginibacter sp. CAU 1740 TaxID=3140365 RepID=UPI00325BDF0C